jgi:acyl carrier protein
MSDLSPLELEVARLIVETLGLENLRAEEIGAESPLFGDGLGLDSIDALELALAVGRKYDVQVRSDDVDNKRIFASLRALSHYIEQRSAAA